MVAALATMTSRSTMSEPREQQWLDGAPQDGDVLVPARKGGGKPDAMRRASVREQAPVTEDLHGEHGPASEPNSQRASRPAKRSSEATADASCASDSRGRR
jgi:hypothetical protein